MVIGTQQKNRRHLPRCLLQKIIHSDFLRRHYPHQVKGSKFGYFLSACFTSSPVFDCDCILHPLRTNCKRGQRRAQRCKTFFTQVLGRFTQVLLKKKVNYGIFKVDAYPPPVSNKEEFRTKPTNLTQRLLSALVALCMVLSVCAPAFADVTDPDMAKAAQWCTEQGTMAAKGDRFEPEGWTPKFKVIEVWNKTFPAA